MRRQPHKQICAVAVTDDRDGRLPLRLAAVCQHSLISGAPWETAGLKFSHFLEEGLVSDLFVILAELAARQGERECRPVGK